MQQQIHTPPIPPSPARLNLPNNPISSPNRNNPVPIIPNNPSNNKPSSSTPTTTAPTTSTALLPLLPPLPRAQSILPLLSSLLPHLFHLSPHRPFWLSSYRNNLPTFHSSTPPSSKELSKNSKQDILSQFHSLHSLLSDSVQELHVILDLHDQRHTLSSQVRSLDSSLLEFTKKLLSAEHVLDTLLDDYDHFRHPKRSKTNSDISNTNWSLDSKLNLDEILSYSHRISYTTFAPPEHGAGLAPLRGALPPAPQDNEMRASQLYQFADLDVGLPKKKAEVKEGEDAENVEILLQPTPPREELNLGVQPPMLPISVPPGWRKGMPVELPTELPPVPLGWKPGDPITLPLDGVFGAARPEEARVPAVAVGPAAKVPEAIQVKYVQLDINPDQDDYSSDYSSEVGSSEEDEDD